MRWKWEKRAINLHESINLKGKDDEDKECLAGFMKDEEREELEEEKFPFFFAHNCTLHSFSHSHNSFILHSCPAAHSSPKLTDFPLIPIAYTLQSIKYPFLSPSSSTRSNQWGIVLLGSFLDLLSLSIGTLDGNIQTTRQGRIFLSFSEWRFRLRDQRVFLSFSLQNPWDHETRWKRRAEK